MSDLMQEQSVPGVAIALVAFGNVIRIDGFGYSFKASNQRSGAHATFESKGMAKLVTQLGILQLAKDKKLDLRAPIGQYLPNLPEAWRGLGVQDILTHQVALPDYQSQPDFDMTCVLTKNLDSKCQPFACTKKW